MTNHTCKCAKHVEINLKRIVELPYIPAKVLSESCLAVLEQEDLLVGNFLERDLQDSETNKETSTHSKET